MELSELKRSREIMLSVLKLSKPGRHLACPFHNGSDSFDVLQMKDGIWFWKCWGGCGHGTVIDAAMKIYRVPSWHDACKAMETELGIKIFKDEDLIEPQIDHDRAEGFVADAHENLMNSLEIQEKWMRKKRGIFNLDVIKRYRIGFATHEDGFKFQNIPRLGKEKSKPWTWRLCSWVLPITNAAGVLVGVKLHNEKSPFPWSPIKYPKSFWAPFGTYPATDPKDGTATLWPPPEDFTGVETLALCPGELKALSCIADGNAATSPTAGESTLRSELVRRIVATNLKRLAVVVDNDAPKLISGKLVSKGNDWKESVVKALKGEGIPCFPVKLDELKGSHAPETRVSKNTAGASSAIRSNPQRSKGSNVPQRAEPLADAGTQAKAPNLEAHVAALARTIASGWSAEETELIEWFFSAPNLPPHPSITYYDRMRAVFATPRDELLGNIADAWIRDLKIIRSQCA